MMDEKSKDMIREDLAAKIKQAATKTSPPMTVEELKEWLKQFKG